MNSPKHNPAGWRRARVIALGFGLFLVAGYHHSAAQQSDVSSYAAKFVCGKVDVTTQRAVQGQYRTMVNIHNPNGISVQFDKKVVIALPERRTPRGRISDFVGEILGPDEAMAVDCKDILDLLGGGGNPNVFRDGFVVLHVPTVNGPLVLDVTGVLMIETPTGTSIALDKVDPNIIVAPVPLLN